MLQVGAPSIFVNTDRLTYTSSKLWKTRHRDLHDTKLFLSGGTRIFVFFRLSVCIWYFATMIPYRFCTEKKPSWWLWKGPWQRRCKNCGFLYTLVPKKWTASPAWWSQSWGRVGIGGGRLRPKVSWGSGKGSRNPNSEAALKPPGAHDLGWKVQRIWR